MESSRLAGKNVQTTEIRVETPGTEIARPGQSGGGVVGSHVAHAAEMGQNMVMQYGYESPGPRGLLVCNAVQIWRLMSDTGREGEAVAMADGCRRCSNLAGES